ncbi:MAG: CRISPR-associated ring nuclease [Anaerolineae bacterium]|nr:CRISPR-associated ring nuclease [Anaerolineae bacterium]MDW8070980.1 CRISPR-associated ring nuclease [Anaerolineae bacterium]
MTTESLLLVTMGGQPQVVTFALDWLLARGEIIREVVVVHLSPTPDLLAEYQRTQRALERLHREFSGDHYQGRPCRLRLVPIRYDDVRLADIRSEADADVVWSAIYQLLITLKAQGRPLHLCIAGGRRIMGLLTLSAAMLLCGHQDHVWHMYTPTGFRECARNGSIMHARPEDGVRLIRVPFVPWGAYFPALRDLMMRSPAEVIAAQTAQLEAAEYARCRSVFEQLTRRQRDVLRLFALGNNPQGVAEQLHITLATVNTHKTVILDQCRIAWNLPEDAYLSYHFIHDHFARFFQRASPAPNRYNTGEADLAL